MNVGVWETVSGDVRAQAASEHTKGPLCGPFPKRLKGLEPSTFCMASRRSSQLSYSRRGRGSIAAVARSLEGPPDLKRSAALPITRRMSSATHRLLLLAVAVAALTLAVAAPAGAFRLGAGPGAVAGNPADHLADLPPTPRSTTRRRTARRRRAPAWSRSSAGSAATPRGANWGTYRCEKWGPHEASLHAENRAVDWHLDVNVPADRAAARDLIELLLAPDRLGLPHALARRMGVEEIIWDCSYWGAGMDEFKPYSPCFKKNGERRKPSTRPSGTSTTCTSACRRRAPPSARRSGRRTRAEPRRRVRPSRPASPSPGRRRRRASRGRGCRPRARAGRAARSRAARRSRRAGGRARSRRPRR